MATNIIAATMPPETAGNGSSFDAMQNKGGDSRVLDVKVKTLLEHKDPSRERGEEMNGGAQVSRTPGEPTNNMWAAE